MKELSPEVFYGLLGAFLAIVNDLIPGYNVWFKKLEDNQKKYLILSYLFIIAFIILGLNCWSLTSALMLRFIPVACTEAGIFDFVTIFFSALVGSQAVFLIKPKSKKLIEKAKK